MLYRRKLLSEEDYDVVEFKNIKLRSLNRSIKADSKRSNYIVNWITGAFDALGKKYLKKLSIVVCQDSERKQVIEEYNINYSYEDG